MDELNSPEADYLEWRELIDDSIVLAQREADWAAFIADMEREWQP